MQVEPATDLTKLDNIGRFADAVFTDLKDLAAHDQRVFDELFYNRENDFTMFKSIMEDASSTAVNVVIIGDAGVGKSNFIYKLVRHTDGLDALHLYPIIVDYRNQMPANSRGCLIHFITEMEKYFAEIDCPVHALKETTEEFIDHNMRACWQHLENLPIDGPPAKHLVVILDDFDYAEDVWFELLEYFLPLATSRRASVVFTVRPLLLAEVEEYDDRFATYYVRNCQRIPLAPLDVARVISQRIALVLVAKDGRGLYARLIDWATRNSDGLRGVVMRRLGIRDLSQLPTFEYPFTEKHNLFMKRITNGNMREVFDIATDSLIYMLDPRYERERRVEDGTERIRIGREGYMRLFLADGVGRHGEAYDRKRTNYRVLDLHTTHSTQGNSLLFNVLEAVKLRGVIDDTFFSVLADFGHRQKDVEHGIQYLSNRTRRLICPVRLRPRSKSWLWDDVPEYKITEKGDYYLQICEWDEYIERCGGYGRSIQQEGLL